MTALFDTNVLIGLSKDDSEHHQWCIERLIEVQTRGTVFISDIVYCEFSVGMQSKDHADTVLSEFGLERIGMSDDALFMAATAYKAYKANGGPKARVLPDFLVGAAAASAGIPLVTANPADFKGYFPELEIVAP